MPAMRRLFIDYGVAIGASGAALLVNLALWPLMQSNTFPVFLGAVMLGTWHGGLGPGVASALVTMLINNYVFASPGQALPLASAGHAVRALVYLCTALLIAGLAARHREAVHRAARDSEALREREAQLRALVTSVQDYSIVMLDADGRIVSWSPGGERVHGYRAEEIVGQHFSRLYSAEDAARGRPAAALEQARATGRFEEEGWRVRKDGSRFWASSIIAPVSGDRGLRGFSKVTRDITERHRADEALRASEARFRERLELLPDGIVIVDVKGRIVFANTQASHLFGYGPQELLNQTVEVLIPESRRRVHADHRAIFTAAPRRRPMGVGLELAGQRKDGGTFPVEISLSPIEADGETVVIAAIRDVTARRHADAEIQRLNTDLTHRVAELAAVNRELETFSYSVSHDLRAPLRGIDGFGQALEEEYDDKLDDVGRDYLRRIRAATRRMGDLIDDLLNLSRVTRREMVQETVDLSTLARSVVAQLRRAEPARDVRVTIADGLVAQGDPHLLRIALENLLGNAWKFTGRAAQGTIALGATELDGTRAFFIRDNGVGFDMEFADKLFGAFQRLHGVKDFPGTGIGLATVQRIVTRHGGRIWAEAALGKGATFYFTL
jgi:PAS domain S-box-containing protein